MINYEVGFIEFFQRVKAAFAFAFENQLSILLDFKEAHVFEGFQRSDTCGARRLPRAIRPHVREL